MPNFERLSDESTGTCPVKDCGDPAYSYAAEGVDGYVDACPKHAKSCLIDAGLLDEEPVSTPGEGPAFLCWTDKLAEDEDTIPY